MSEFANAMEIFKLLDKSNCRKCNEGTCLAFASKVFLGQKQLADCPHLDESVLAKYQGVRSGKERMDEEFQAQLDALRKKVVDCDLKEAAQRVGGVYEKGKLTIRIFGKPLTIDQEGNFITDLHVNPWIVVPVVGYVLECKGVPLTGKWVPLRELKGGREKNGLFVKRSEKPFKHIADQYPDLFEDLIILFSGKKVDQQFDADISLVLQPLPRLPLLVCYWKPDGEMESDLHLFFDSSADMNANIDIVYSIGAGIVTMFEKISKRHGAGIVS